MSTGSLLDAGLHQICGCDVYRALSYRKQVMSGRMQNRRRRFSGFSPTPRVPWRLHRAPDDNLL